MDRMNYIRGEVRRNGESRMEPLASLTIGQMRSLPNGTEVLVTDIAPFGFGLNQRILVVDDVFKEGLLDPSQHEDCDHGMSVSELEEQLFPGSMFVVLYPENWEPSIESMLNEKFTKRGVREGREGAPMYSEAGLKTRYSDDEWHDGAYSAYVTAYKRAAEARKGR